MAEGVQAAFSAESATDTDRALDEARRWIEACTGSPFPTDNFRLAVRDGVLLCRLANVIQEGSVNISRVQKGAQATFMWLENLNYFIKACKKLGLKGGQLFDPTDLIIDDQAGTKFQSGKRTEQERRVRNVAITVYWLGRKANKITTFEGPKLNLTEFTDIVPGAAAPEHDEPEQVATPTPTPTPEVVETEVITTVTREVRRVIKSSPNAPRQVVSEDVSEKKVVEETRQFTRKSSATELRSAFMRRSSDANMSSAGRTRTGSRSTTEISPYRVKSGGLEAQENSESVAISLDLQAGESVFGFELADGEPGQPTVVSSVEKDGSADRGGLRTGDKMFWLNGETVAFASRAEVDSLIAVICTKERMMTLGIRRLVPAKIVEEPPPPEPTPEPLEPAPPTKVEEEVVATMIMQEEAGPVDLAAALKEFEEKAGPAEPQDETQAEPPSDSNRGEEAAALTGIILTRGFTEGSTDGVSSTIDTTGLEKVDESSSMQRISDVQSINPHGQQPTVYISKPPEVKREETPETVEDTTQLGLAAAQSAVVVQDELPRPEVTRRKWSSSSPPPPESPTPSVEDDSLAALLRRLQKKYGEEEDKEKYDKLVALVSTKEFAGALEAHRALAKAQGTGKATGDSSDAVCPICRKTQRGLSAQEEEAETKAALAEIMAAPHFRGLCWSHDQLLQKKKQETSSSEATTDAATAADPTPVPPVEKKPPPVVEAAAVAVVANHVESAPEPKVTEGTTDGPIAAASRENGHLQQPVVVVVEKKAGKPLGATIRTHEGKVYLARLMAGSTLAMSGKIHVDDELLEVNGTPVSGQSIESVAALMAKTPEGKLVLKINPVAEPGDRAASVDMKVRALFDFDPAEDELLPCKDVGLRFKKGDILHIVNQEDPDWWQAVRDGGGDNNMAGLIPSRFLQERRESYHLVVQDDIAKTDKKSGKKKSKIHIPKRKKKKASLYEAKKNAYNLDEVLTYEEVILVQPDATKRRPIVVVGPMEGGRETLKMQVVDHDPSRFATAVPHTTRPQREDEEPGVVYHFISMPEFERKMKNNDFFEHGMHNGNYYGTSIDAVCEVVLSGRTCIITAHPDSLHLLKASNMQPYVVFLRPPSSRSLPQSEEENALAKASELADKMEELYGHMFDKTVVNVDDDVTLHELLDTAHFLQTQPQWVHLVRQ